MPYTPSGFFCDRLIRERERRDGEGSLNKPLRFNGQDYNTLRQEFLQRKTLFEDETFPATVESLGFKELGHKSNKVKNIVWKRPKVGGGTLLAHGEALWSGDGHMGSGMLFLVHTNESIKEKLYFSGLKKELFYGEKCLLLWKFT